MDIETVFKYWALDWLAMSLSLLGVYWLGNKKKAGFLIIAGANLVWVFLGAFLMDSIGISLGNVVFLIMNVRGYSQWKIKHRKAEKRSKCVYYANK